MNEKDEFARDIVSEKEMVSSIIHISDDNSKSWTFKMPIFDYSAFFIEKDGYIHGKVYNDIQKVWKEKKWNKETGKVYGSGNAAYFDLVPVKQDIPKTCDGKWNGHYIHASKEAYDLFVAEWYSVEDKCSYEVFAHIGTKYFVISPSSMIESFSTEPTGFKPLYIVDGKFSPTEYHPDVVAFSASSAFCKKEVCDSDDLDAFTVTEDESYKYESKVIHIGKGGSTSYYDLPHGAKTLQDLIEHRNMNGSIKDIFKACYRLGKKDANSDIDDVTKMAYYALRELGRLTGTKDFMMLAEEIIGQQSIKS